MIQLWRHKSLSILLKELSLDKQRRIARRIVTLLVPISSESFFLSITLKDIIKAVVTSSDVRKMLTAGKKQLAKQGSDK